jgi:hypothetical protein
MQSLVYRALVCLSCLACHSSHEAANQRQRSHSAVIRDRKNRIALSRFFEARAFQRCLCDYWWCEEMRRAPYGLARV